MTRPGASALPVRRSAIRFHPHARYPARSGSASSAPSHAVAFPPDHQRLRRDGFRGGLRTARPREVVDRRGAITHGSDDGLDDRSSYAPLRAGV